MTAILNRTRINVVLALKPEFSAADKFELMNDLLTHGFDLQFCDDASQLNTINPDNNERLVLVTDQDLSDSNNQFHATLSLNTIDLDAIVIELQQLQQTETEASPAAKPQKRWKPWFPVIDYKRCTNCMQCLSFCLFDVYGVDKDGNIQVQNQSNCKTDCPACSRVCPDVAILFPKYHHGPINGDVVKEDDVRREAMKVDISSLLGGDIYKMLRERSAKAKSRFSRERDDKRALKERKRCLTKLKETMGISDEILASLPSLDQIQKKAAEAKARADEARANLEKRSQDPK